MFWLVYKFDFIAMKHENDVSNVVDSLRCLLAQSFINTELSFILEPFFLI